MSPNCEAPFKGHLVCVCAVCGRASLDAHREAQAAHEARVREEQVQREAALQRMREEREEEERLLALEFKAGQRMQEAQVRHQHALALALAFAQLAHLLSSHVTHGLGCADSSSFVNARRGASNMNPDISIPVLASPVCPLPGRGQLSRVSEVEEAARREALASKRRLTQLSDKALQVHVT